MLPDDDPGGWFAACFCAEWCGVCRGWRAAFDEVQAALPGWRFRWVDVEDEEDIMQDFDVETFPLVLVAKDGVLRHFAPVDPSVAALRALLARLQARENDEPPRDAEGSALLARLLG